MKKIIISLTFFCQVLSGQSYDPAIQSMMNNVNLDSLVSYVRILSGEDSVVINGTKVLIEHRIASSGNDLALEYIKNKMNEFGYETVEQIYSQSGKNLYAVQQGVQFPDKYFIVCAHYDSKALHSADDNASGVAGVLEAARIFSGMEFNYSILYAFWDEEEIGLIGSYYFAGQADSIGMDIKGVLNFEMSGWDSNNDGLMDIHTRPINESINLANTMYAIDSIYNLPLLPVIYNPGTSASDHASFWAFNYSAIVFSEAFYGGDMNPFYHTSLDRIEWFNLPYYHNVVKLFTGTIATLATEGIVTDAEEPVSNIQHAVLYNYPNPFNYSTKVAYTLPVSSDVRISLFNSLGQNLKTIVSGYQEAGKHEINLSMEDYSSGVYLLVLRTELYQISHKVILLK